MRNNNDLVTLTLNTWTRHSIFREEEIKVKLSEEMDTFWEGYRSNMQMCGEDKQRLNIDP